MRTGMADLEDAILQWTTVQSALAESNEALATAVEEFEVLLAELGDMRAVWELTHDSAAEQELPEASIARIGANLESLGEVRTEVRAYRDELLTVQGELAPRMEQARLRKAALEAEREKVRASLLSSDSVPLWRIELRGEQFAQLGRQLGATSRTRRAQLVSFGHEAETRLVLHGALLVGMVALIFTLRRRSRQWQTEDPRFEATRKVLSRPASAALLVAVLPMPWLYPDAPQAVGNIVGLVILIPTLRMMTALVSRSVHGAIWLLVPFYLITRIVELTTEFVPLLRMILLVETLAGLALLIWMHRPASSLRTLDARAWRGRVLLVMRLAALLLCGSLIANVAGHVRLALLFTTGVFKALYILLIIYAGARILEALLWAVLRTRWARAFPSIRNNAELVYTKTRLGTRFGLTLLYVYLVLRTFEILDPTYAALQLTLEAGFTIGSLSVSVGGTLAFVITIWASFALSRFFRFVLNEDVVPRVSLPRGVPQTMSKLAHYAILLLGFFVAVSAAGIELSNLVLLTGAFGVGLGFGLQTVVNNFVSGLILLFERPIKVGDVVEVGALMGTVRQIGMRASFVQTWDGAEVIVPNGNLVSAEVVNWTLSDRRRRIELPVGVAYGTDPQQVIDLLLDVARSHDDILSDPEPTALFMGFGDSSLDFSLRAWSGEFDDYLRVKSEITVAVSEALKAAEIEIPFPQHDLHVRSVDAEAGDSLTGKG
jgi:small-conductance mechanosensitive channel